MRQEYVPPAVEDLGSLHEVTLGGSLGISQDGDFPVGASADIVNS